MTKYYGAGDFRSRECIEILKEADIIITNPPFSLFREYLAQLISYNKKFLILGNINAVQYKKIFPLFIENKIWLGISTNPESKEGCKGVMEFCAPKSYEIETKSCREDEEGNKYVKFNNIRWFTNLNTSKRNKPLHLAKNYYSPEEYPKYDNYDAINVDKVADIPRDYPGVMGVPITFMDKYCPEQFEILGISGRGNNVNFKTKIYTKEDADNYGDLNRGPTLVENRKKKNLYFRIFIKNKHPDESKYREKNISEA